MAKNTVSKIESTENHYPQIVRDTLNDIIAELSFIRHGVALAYGDEYGIDGMSNILARNIV